MVNWWLIDIGLTVVGVGLIAWATILHCVGYGKHITRPMVIVWALWKAKRMIRRGQLSGQFNVEPSLFRFGQLFALLVICWWFTALSFLIPGFPLNMLTLFFYWVPLIALYTDDLLTTIDKDKWKKRWQAAKNKVKWKWLPAPIPAPIK